MPIKVSIVNGQLIRVGRPAFSAEINHKLMVRDNEDRRHILHGASQITDILIASFNRIIKRSNITKLNHLTDKLLLDFKRRQLIIRFSSSAPLEAKIQRIINIAFCRKENLVVGPAIANQGIEKARKTISTIRSKLDDFCSEDIKSLEEIKRKVITELNSSLNNSEARGLVASYRKQILKVLIEACEKCKTVIEILRTLADFELSCTLDIVHEGTTKTDNIWGLTKAAELRRAIYEEDDKAIFKILL